jgi:hypothetical protein
MKKVILALLCCMAVPAFADKPAPPPVHHKKHKKVTVVTPPVEAPPVVVPPVETPTPPPPVVVIPPLPPPAVVPPRPVLPPKVCKKEECPPEGTWFGPTTGAVVPNVHIAVGLGAQNPWASGLAGARIEFPKAYLGLEPFISMPNGFGVDGLVYAYRGKTVQFYPLSVGFMLNFAYNNNHLFLSDTDINRVIDLRLGLGVQIKLVCHLKLAIDWRVSIPDPLKLANENGVCHNCGNHAVRLDAPTAIGNAFAQSQLLIGLLFQ